MRVDPIAIPAKLLPGLGMPFERLRDIVGMLTMSGGEQHLVVGLGYPRLTELDPSTRVRDSWG